MHTAEIIETYVLAPVQHQLLQRFGQVRDLRLAPLAAAAAAAVHGAAHLRSEALAEVAQERRDAQGLRRGRARSRADQRARAANRKRERLVLCLWFQCCSGRQSLPRPPETSWLEVRPGRAAVTHPTRLHTTNIRPAERTLLTLHLTSIHLMAANFLIIHRAERYKF